MTDLPPSSAPKCEHTAGGATTEGISCTLGAGGFPDDATRRHTDDGTGFTMGLFCATHSAANLDTGQTAEDL